MPPSQDPLKQSALSTQIMPVKQGAHGPPQSISVSSESGFSLQQVFESNLIADAKAVFESLMDESPKAWLIPLNLFFPFKVSLVMLSQ
jgi:hypothetical protein